MFQRLPLYLTIICVLPFVVLSSLAYFHLFDGRVILSLLLTYAAVIISFLGGIHWGFAVTQYAHNRKIANMLLVEGMAPSLIAWGVLFAADRDAQLLTMALLYPFMWAIDSLLYSNNIIPQWFFNLRGILTPLVVVSLYVAYFGIM